MRTSFLRRIAPAVIAASVVLAALPASAGDQLHITSLTAGVVRGDLGPATAPATALDRVADELGVDAGTFVFGRARTSLVGTHQRGYQQVDGLRVDGTSAAVHVIRGRVVKVSAIDSDAVGHAVARPVSRRVAEAAALAAGAIRTTLAVTSERLLVPTNGRLVDTWRISYVASAPAAAASVDVSAATGRVLRTVDDRLFEDATATLFNPNPIATSGHWDMAQDVDAGGADVDYTTDARVAEELVDLPVTGFDLARAAAGNLVGPWADVIGAGPFVPVMGRFDVSKTDPRFEGLMAYAHVDAIQKYFRDVLGMDDVNAEPQTMVALPVQGFDNSFYQPANDLMLFGAGGVDDGEDAEVIIHELGHAIHDDQAEGWSGSSEGGAMGEGFGDFLAASYYATFDDNDRLADPCVMDWDATSYSSSLQTCLRRTDTTKDYNDPDKEVHGFGEVWSAYLWNVRFRLGTTEDERTYNALRVLLNSHYLMSGDGGFTEAIGDMIEVVRSGELTPDLQTAQAWERILLEEASKLLIPLPELQ